MKGEGTLVSREILEGLRDFDTALLANTMGFIASIPAHEFYVAGGIRSLTPDLGPTVGLALTCKIDTSTPGGEDSIDPFYEQVQRVATRGLPTVWVVQTVGSRPDHECVAGDGMAKMLYAAGCLGVVTDGYCRDIAGCLTVPFAVHCRGTIAHHCAIRIKEVDTPVRVGGISIAPDEIVHADREGIIKIPADAAELLAEKAPQMRALEHEAHLLLRRTDVGPVEKRERVSQMFVRYGFLPGKKD